MRRASMPQRATKIRASALTSGFNQKSARLLKLLVHLIAIDERDFKPHLHTRRKTR
jgi:hypothetical protein